MYVHFVDTLYVLLVAITFSINISGYRKYVQNGDGKYVDSVDK